jgi:hypothetical protein
MENCDLNEKKIHDCKGRLWERYVMGYAEERGSLRIYSTAAKGNITISRIVTEQTCEIILIDKSLTK